MLSEAAYGGEGGMPPPGKIKSARKESSFLALKF